MAYASTDYAVGGDCEDDKDWVYPGADEICNGIAEDCEDPNYGGSPALETDNDGDGFVECGGFDPATGSAMSVCLAVGTVMMTDLRLSLRSQVPLEIPAFVHRTPMEMG